MIWGPATARSNTRAAATRSTSSPRWPARCDWAGRRSATACRNRSQLYPSRSASTEKYNAAVDATITQGFVLAADCDALLAFAQPERVNP